MSTLIAILAMALPAAEPAVARSRDRNPCEAGYVMVGPRCRRHPLRHASHVRGCFTYRCDNRMQRKMERRAWGRTLRLWERTVAPLNGYLTRIARCESGLRWHIATGNGFYGGLQFTLQSWAAVGGSGYPHHASPLEQKYRAVLLSRLQGWGAWPNCS